MGGKIPRFDKFMKLSIEKGGDGISGAGQYDPPAVFTQKEASVRGQKDKSDGYAFYCKSRCPEGEAPRPPPAPMINVGVFK